MIRDTSLEAYIAIKPFIPKMKRKVYEAIYELQLPESFPSDEEIVDYLGWKSPSTIRTARKELERRKAIVSAGKKVNSRGMNVHTWRITGEFEELEPRESKADYWKKLYEDKAKQYDELLAMSKITKVTLKGYEDWKPMTDEQLDMFK